MHFTKHFDIPPELMQAISDRNLVVFAGAGVSRTDPLQLPGFESFCKLAEKRFGERRSAIVRGKEQHKEPIDRFLGRIERDGKKVRKLAADVFAPDRDKQTPVHECILKLFGRNAPVRLVTTNWDVYFSIALSRIQEVRAQTYYAPALPPGDSFTGIVYVHGAIDQDSSSLAMTDRDFGRAYLTEGWARRFVTLVFNNRVVLFLGYSHDDPLMHHLARGLPSNSRRFAFVRKNDAEQWSFKGVSPIEFLGNDDKQFHEAVYSTVAAWSDFTWMGQLDHKKRIESLVSREPILTAEEEDYLKDCLHRPATARMFREHAKSKEWLVWLGDHAFLERLFNPMAKLEEAEEIIADWMCGTFLPHDSGLVMHFFQSHGLQFSPQLWRSIVWHIWREQTRPPSVMFARWISVLLEHIPPEHESYAQLEYILKGCSYPDEIPAAISLFAYLTKPRVEVERSFGALFGSDANPRSVDYKVVVPGSSHWLDEVWSNQFRPRLGELHQDLLPIIEANLVAAHRLMRTIGIADQEWDPWSSTRSAVEEHEQDSHREDYFALIDAARDVLDHVCSESPTEGARLQVRWFESRVPLLRRIAVYALGAADNISNDEKLEWVVNQNILFDSSLKHETYSVLQNSVAAASEAGLQALAATTLKGPQGDQTPDNKSHSLRMGYDLLQWVSRYAPHSDSIKAALDKIVAASPGIAPIEHPDLRYWSSGAYVVEHKSPISAEELLSLSIEDAAEQVLMFIGDDRGLDPDRRGLMAEVSRAASRKFDWGLSLGERLVAMWSCDQGVWDALSSAWSNCDLGNHQWTKILGILGSGPELFARMRSIAELLEEGAKRSKGAMSLQVLSKAEEFSDKMWKTACAVPDGTDDDEEWLSDALNSVAGRLTLFWIHALARHRNDPRDQRGLPDDYRKRFERIINGSSHPDQLARVMLVSHLHFIESVDLRWTHKNLIPLLDFNQDESRAEQAWNGFLTWGNFSPTTLPILRPLLSVAAQKYRGSRHVSRERLAMYLLHAIINDSTVPEVTGWFYGALQHFSTDDRISFFRQARVWLLTADSDTLVATWERWLNQLISHRVDNVPCPLDRPEGDVLLEITPALKPVFTKAAKLLLEVPKFELRHSHFYRNLRKSDLALESPDVVVELLIHVLRSATEDQRVQCDNLIEILEQLRSKLSENKLTPLIEELLRIGCKV